MRITPANTESTRYDGLDELLESGVAKRSQIRYGERIFFDFNFVRHVLNIFSILSQECNTNSGAQKAEPQRVAALESVQASALHCSDDNPSPLPSKTQRKYHFGSRSPSGQSPVTKSRKAPQNLLVSASLSATNRDGSDKETNSPKQKSWKHFVTNQFKKMQNSSDSPSSHDNVSECCPLSQCTPVSDFMIKFSHLLTIFAFCSLKKTSTCPSLSQNAQKSSKQKASASSASIESLATPRQSRISTNLLIEMEWTSRL